MTVPQFTTEEYTGRRLATQQGMADRKLDLLLLTAPENIYYLVGFQTASLVADAFLAVPQEGLPFFVTRRLDIGNMFGQVDGALIGDFAVYEDDYGAPSSIEVLVKLLKRHGVSLARIGWEEQSYYLTLRGANHFRDYLPSTVFSDETSLVEMLRWIKSPAEMTCHREAGRIAVETVNASIEAAHVGATDNDVARAGLDAMIRSGGEYVANWPHVRTGHHTGWGHRTWMQRRIELGQPTVIEIAGVVKRYHCPLYKTVIHDAPAGLRAVAEVVAEANEAGRRTLRPGVTNGEVFAAVDQVLHARGYAESGISRNGYMVGIAMQPNWVQRYGISIARGGNILLKPGMVFHFLTVLAKPNEYAVGESSTLALIDDGWTDLTPGVEAGPILRGP